MSKFKLLPIVATLVALSVGASAQTLEKSYHTWSKDDASKILNSQPFSDKYQSEAGVISATNQAIASEQAEQRIGAGPGFRATRNLPPLPVVVRLHSSLPVRQAIARLQEIQAGYDKMSEEDRKKYESSVAGSLECPICKDYYVVTMYKYKNAGMGAVDDGLFQTTKLEDLKGQVWLENDKGERRDLAELTPSKGPGDVAVLYFKRTDDKGAVLLTPENKSFKLVFSSALRSSRTLPYVSLLPPNFEFKVSKMIVGGQVAF